jgi:hypothetical protein
MGLMTIRPSRIFAVFWSAGARRAAGFRGRTTDVDLYYTSFGLALTRLMGEPIRPGDRSYLEAFGDGARTGPGHLVSLIGAAPWPAFRRPPTPRPGLSAFRRPDGGWAQTRIDPSDGGPYAAFLIHLALEDLGGRDPAPDGTAKAVRHAADGWRVRSTPGAPSTTPVTAAAAVVLRALGQPDDGAAAAWLLHRRDVNGGWRATPAAPAPDLLSTAVALFALHLEGGVPREGVPLHLSSSSGAARPTAASPATPPMRIPMSNTPGTPAGTGRPAGALKHRMLAAGDGCRRLKRTPKIIGYAPVREHDPSVVRNGYGRDRAASPGRFGGQGAASGTCSMKHERTGLEGAAPSAPFGRPRSIVLSRSPRPGHDLEGAAGIGRPAAV